MPRRPTLPIPETLVRPFYETVWSLASVGYCNGANGVSVDWRSRTGKRAWGRRGHALAVLWLTACAMRFSEFAQLQTNDVSLGSASVWVQRSKNSQSDEIDIARTLITLTFDWRSQRTAAFESPWLIPTKRGTQLENNNFNRDCCGMFARMFGIRLSSHCFRDTACQLAMAQSNQLRVVQRLLGHRSAKSTEHYLAKQRARAFQLALFEPSVEDYAEASA